MSLIVKTRIKNLRRNVTSGYMMLDSDESGTGKMHTDTIFNNFARQFDDSYSYSEGDFCMNAGSFYKFKQSHQGTWNDSDVDQVSVEDMIKEIKQEIPELGTITLD